MEGGAAAKPLARLEMGAAPHLEPCSAEGGVSDATQGPGSRVQLGCLVQVASLDAMIMAHGDDAGLRLPPELAPVQVRGKPCCSALWTHECMARTKASAALYKHMCCQA